MLGLQSRNIEVSQSTLSRDIQELRLAKAGGFYTIVGAEQSRRGTDEALRRIIREFVTGLDAADNLVVVKTGSGHASTVSQALDEAEFPEAIGSIAGENTIFVAVRSSKDGRKLEKKLRDMLL